MTSPWCLRTLRGSGSLPGPNIRGCSSAGRAVRSQCTGQGFDPPQLHIDTFRGSDDHAIAAPEPETPTSALGLFFFPIFSSCCPGFPSFSVVFRRFPVVFPSFSRRFPSFSVVFRRFPVVFPSFSVVSRRFPSFSVVFRRFPVVFPSFSVVSPSFSRHFPSFPLVSCGFLPDFLLSGVDVLKSLILPQRTIGLATAGPPM